MHQYTDLKESFDGDLILEGGDLSDTGNRYDVAAYQIVKTILNSKPGEFPLYPNLGFDSDLYVGSQNTQKLADDISKSIKTAIAQSSPFYYSEIDIEYYPLNKETIAFNIVILTSDSERKGYSLAYDTSTNMTRSFV